MERISKEIIIWGFIIPISIFIIMMYYPIPTLTFVFGMMFGGYITIKK